MEEWRDIKGYEGCYQVSDLGRVRSLDRIVRYRNGTVREYAGIVLKQKVMSNGYMVVRLTRNKNVENALVHRLVAAAFIQNDDGKPFINHIDCDRSNNRVSNLEWVTASDNINYAPTKERMRRSKTEQRGRAVVQIDPLSGKEIGRFFSIADAARNVSTTVQNIYLICSGKRGHHTAAGYVWRYEDMAVR